MNITFDSVSVACRSLVNVRANKLKINDLVEVPDSGILVKVLTVQNDCPIWESKHRTKTAVVFETEDHQIVPMSECSGQFHVYRPVRSK